MCKPHNAVFGGTISPYAGPATSQRLGSDNDTSWPNSRRFGDCLAPRWPRTATVVHELRKLLATIRASGLLGHSRTLDPELETAGLNQFLMARAEECERAEPASVRLEVSKSSATVRIDRGPIARGGHHILDNVRQSLSGDPDGYTLAPLGGSRQEAA